MSTDSPRLPSRRSATAIGYVMLAVAFLVAMRSVASDFAKGDHVQSLTTAVLAVSFVLVGALALRARPHNGAVWALIWALFFGAMSEWGRTYGFDSVGVTPEDVEGLTVGFAPSDVDWVTALALSIPQWAWLPSVFVLSTHLILLFPNGELKSPRWRWVLVGSTVAIFVTAMPIFLATAPWSDRPYDEAIPGFWGLPLLVLLALSVVSLVGLILRFRASTGEERLQYRWVTWALALYVVSVVTPIETGNLTLVAVPISIGIAITKYRLYDIDVVISRTLVFAVLMGFITLVYAGLVVGVGEWLGGSTLGWQIAATALVAVVFEPVRERVQRWVNRLVLGRRATPYEVLSDLTGRLAATEREEGLLGRMAVRLSEGTGADRAVVWVAEESVLRAVACEPESERPDAAAHGIEDVPGMVVPITHDGVVLGALSVESRRGDALTQTEQRLVEDLAGSAGLLMRRLRLDAELERKADELAESRRRLVDAQDVERRRLERELNEGAQQQVVALKVQLAMAGQEARAEGVDVVAGLIAQVESEAQDAIDQIRALANGIYPPLLEAEGLPAAVRALGELAPVEVTVDADVSQRCPLAVEAAVYFCVSEALTNAVKHGQPPIRITVSDVPGELTFSVTDGGPGFDPTTVQRGAGLNNMADRLDAFNGMVAIDSRSGTSTTIVGRVPFTSEVGVL